MIQSLSALTCPDLIYIYNIIFPVSDRVNNFPPLPPFMRIKSCFYQNIEEEIPELYQQLVKRIYTLWMSMFFHIS